MLAPGRLLISLRWMHVGLIRTAERLLPGFILRVLVAPTVFRARFRQLPGDLALLPQFKRLPAGFFKPTPLIIFRERYRRSSTDLVRHWPDRLGEPRWQKRCRLHGEEILRESLASGRPLVLATLHYGATLEMYHWLRTIGLPMAAMTSAHLDTSDVVREHLAFLADAASRLTGVPRVFGTSMDDLFDIREFLQSPKRALLIAIDGHIGSHQAIARADGMAINVQLGAFTIAAVCNAIVIPCLSRALSRMRCEIHFRAPVPDKLVGHRRSAPAAAEHVLRELVPLIRDCPTQADARLLLNAGQEGEAFSPNIA